MKVLKFGGSSMASSKSIELIVNILKKEQKKQHIWVVVSASGKTTNNLIELMDLALAKDLNYKFLLQEIEQHHIKIAKDLITIDNQSSIIASMKQAVNELDDLLNSICCLGDLSLKTKDKIVSYGELLSSQLLQAILNQKLDSCILKDSKQLIKTDSNYTNAKVNFEKTIRLIQDFQQLNTARVTILGGFMSSNDHNDVTTLGRGGSDYTAAIYAAALNAICLEIWTDVNGLYTANPQIVPQANPICNISYEEAMELSHFGAKVIYPPTIQPVLNKSIPIRIKNTFNAEAIGTLISNEINNQKQTVKGISHIDHISLMTIEGAGMIGIHGTSKHLFEVLGNNQINVILITQASSEHSICIAIADSEAEKALAVINQEFRYEIKDGLIKPVNLEDNLAIIAVVGDNMKSHQGISGTLFNAMGRNNINIRAIAQGASERNISVVINETDVQKALNSIHSAFFESHIKDLNVFIAGVGNVGGILLEQIQKQQSYLKEELHINLKVLGLANSKNYLINEDGIDLNNWKENLNKSKQSNHLFNKEILGLNKRNCVFVDVTANEKVANSYADFLRNSISVVACNKIACSSNYSNYQELKYLAKKYKASFLYETNVGAGLPIINTLQNLISSGDQITEIQAVLSGSLNFIFNHYSKDNLFKNIVKQAQDEGYTEPDPRIDLSGIDVARKILILVREAGIELEINDINNDSFLPSGSMEAKSVNDFYKLIKSNESQFKNVLEKAEKAQSKLKYVATYKNGKANVGLQFIPKDHPFYNLEGKDNIVSFYTKRYVDQPLIIKGAGAGASVTASGLFADIIQVGNLN
ncbi:bifunctional aspartate kinase/homoserine dehydrogenase I [Pseudofulvibacter geojedonensis]|uniref:Bifunctional aspartate kinase/homoserine dehydrogenase I n=1 Tax=Pseudofulvibacter geojedonensis TaxID=1123758 RepID=A0ABW3I2X5_9FLAO